MTHPTRAVLTASLALLLPSQAALIAGWDFDTTANGGTAITPLATPPTVMTANYGTGTLHFDDNYTSSLPGSLTIFQAFLGSTINATAPPPDPSFAGNTYGLFFGDDNGPSQGVFKFSTLGLGNLNLSYALSTQNGWVLGPDPVITHWWDYSTDGTNWSTLAEMQDQGSGFFLFSKTGITGLDNLPNAFLRLRLGASGTSGIVIDNVRINATAIPEPTAPALTCGLLITAAACHRRRRPQSRP